MHKSIRFGVLTILAALLAGCGLLTTPPTRFPQLNERQVEGPGRFDSPKWSRDGRYLAFIDDDRKAIVVYEVSAQQTRIIDIGAYIRQFDWDSQGHLTYMYYRTDLSGSPFPEVFDLHQVNVDGTNGHVVFGNLYSPTAFEWLPDNRWIVGILATATSEDGLGDIYLVDTITGQFAQILSRNGQNVKRFVELSLSSDGTMLAARGIRQSNEGNLSVITIYDLNARRVVKEMFPREKFRDLTMGDLSLHWASGRDWLLFEGSVTGGECYKNALFLFNIEDTSRSFCIPTAGAPISTPVLSPDAERLAFITYEGRDYMMMGDFTSEYRSRLK